MGTALQNTFHFMGMACLSKLAASVITYPALVLRSRLQIRPPQFTGFVECCTWTWRQQGILGTHGSAWLFMRKVRWHRLLTVLLGFYAGFWPNVWKVMPAAIITFVAYENIAKLLSAQRSSSSASAGR